MEPRKTKEADLERKRTLFMQIGFAIALLIVIVGFEWKSYDRSEFNLGQVQMQEPEDELIPITKPEDVPPPPPPPPVQEIEIVEDEKEIENEVEIEVTEVTQETAVIPITPRQEETTAEPEIFTIVERMPAFRGCEKEPNEDKRFACTGAKIAEYFSKSIVYPRMAIDNNIEGIVYVTFVIDATGNVKDVKVLRGVGSGLDQEAIRVATAMPKWSPGQQRGKPVAVQYNVPVNFRLR
ncbi:energy transducer TonB [soil metagenome]